jgi:hypothetical protein
MKKSFYFVASAPPEDSPIVGIVKVTVDMNEVKKAEKHDAIKSELKIVFKVNDKISDKDIIDLFGGPIYKEQITEYDEKWMIAVSVFNDMEYYQEHGKFSPEAPEMWP